MDPPTGMYVRMLDCLEVRTHHSYILSTSFSVPMAEEGAPYPPKVVTGCPFSTQLKGSSNPMQSMFIRLPQTRAASRLVAILTGGIYIMLPCATHNGRSLTSTNFLPALARSSADPVVMPPPTRPCSLPQAKPLYLSSSSLEEGFLSQVLPLA